MKRREKVRPDLWPEKAGEGARERARADLHEREGQSADLATRPGELPRAEGEQQRAGRVLLPRAVGKNRVRRRARASDDR